MNKNFSGKNAVYVSSPYSKEHSCKKSEKSLVAFLGKIGNYQLTNVCFKYLVARPPPGAAITPLTIPTTGMP